MKKSILRRLVSVCLLVLMLFQAFPASAAGSNIFVLEVRVPEANEFYGMYYAYQTPDVDFSTSCRYYDQLANANQKLVYQAILQATPNNNRIELELTDIPEIPIPEEGFTQDFVDRIYAYLYETVLPAYATAYMDTPRLFWTNSVQVGGSLSYDEEIVTAIDVVCILNCNEGCDQTTYEKSQRDLMAKLDSLSFDDSQDTYHLLKQIHDYLCETVTYMESANSHNILGPLLTGKAVCEGYVKSFKLLCDLYEIPCMIITGVGISEAHAWNVVRMDDDMWYAIDPTWDDQPDQIHNDFFLVGASSIPTHFEAIPFQQSHHIVNDFYQDGLVILETPAISDNAYGFEAPHTHTYSFFLTGATCTQKGYTTYTCSGCGDTYQTDFVDAKGHTYKNGKCIVCGQKDSGTSTVKTGDINGDNKINVADYALVKRYVLRTFTMNEEQKKVADVTGDGRINIADYTILKRFVMGSLKQL